MMPCENRMFFAHDSFTIRSGKGRASIVVKGAYRNIGTADGVIIGMSLVCWTEVAIAGSRTTFSPFLAPF